MQSIYRICAIGVLGSLLLAGAPPTLADDAPIESVGPLLWQPSMNVFRRFTVEREKMFEFYGDVLGLEQLETFNVGGGSGVSRFQAGQSEIKLTNRVEGRSYIAGGVEDATGLRLLTFFYPDRAAVLERFRAHRYAEPEFAALPGSNRESALVQDPDGHSVELVVVPNASAGTYETVEVGLTVSDLETSLEFYRDFVGLEEMPPVRDDRFDTVKYPFRHGTTIVSLRSFDSDLPSDTGSGGIQYVVTEVEAVDVLAKTRGVVIDQPLNQLRGFGVRTIWLDDPDGITNYFAETAQSREAVNAPPR